MKNLAILIDRLGYSQKFRSITLELNRINPDINATVFFCDNGVLPEKTNFPIMEMVNAYIFNGIVIATDVFTAKVMNNIMRAKKKFFYPWDMEHLYVPYGYEILRDVYSNDLIARNQDRYDVLKSTWKEPEYIIEDFNHEQLERLFN